MNKKMLKALFTLVSIGAVIYAGLWTAEMYHLKKAEETEEDYIKEWRRIDAVGRERKLSHRISDLELEIMVMKGKMHELRAQLHKDDPVMILNASDVNAVSSDQIMDAAQKAGMKKDLKK